MNTNYYYSGSRYVYYFPNTKHKIVAPPFSSLGGSGTHVSTHWQIFTLDNDSSAKVFELVDSTSYLTTLQVQKYWWDGCAECYLKFEYDYNGYIRCRYKNNSNEYTRWSSWNKISYELGTGKAKSVDTTKTARIDYCPGCGYYYCSNYEVGYIKKQCSNSSY